MMDEIVKTYGIIIIQTQFVICSDMIRGQDNMTDDQSQYGNPRGDEGFETMKEMNEEHVPQITWGIEHLPEIRPVNILDVGCGGGIFTRMMLERYPGSRGCGIDISESAIEYADEFDSEFVDIGRLQLTIGDVQDMPYSNGTFDVVVSNASHFFWKDLKAGFREINRVMVPDGILCLTAGMHFSEE